MTILLAGFTSTPNSLRTHSKYFKVLPFTALKRTDANRIAISFREVPNIAVLTIPIQSGRCDRFPHLQVLQLKAPPKRRLL